MDTLIPLPCSATPNRAMSFQDLPAINATLNGTSAVFLTVGFWMIKRGHKTAHRNCMVCALIASTIFLTLYLVYHYQAGHTRFENPAWFRPYYLGLLATHVLLAAAIVPMVIMTVLRAVRGRFEAHRRLARWTWPLWMYVSVTGVVIYFLLYKIFPQG